MSDRVFGEQMLGCGGTAGVERGPQESVCYVHMALQLVCGWKGCQLLLCCFAAFTAASVVECMLAREPGLGCDPQWRRCIEQEALGRSPICQSEQAVEPNSF